MSLACSSSVSPLRNDATGADALTVFLVAGEPSGDQLGARLMVALRRRSARPIRFLGVGGERMAEEGLDSLFPIEDLSVMGLLEVLPRLPLLRRRLGQTVDAAIAAAPDAVVTIDAPGFSMRVLKQLRRRAPHLPRIHYVAPQVWAWRPGRVRELRGLLDHLLLLVPFEVPFFQDAGIRVTWVGHPVAETIRATSADGPGFRRRHGIPEAATLVAILPGSRRGEVARLLPALRAAMERLAGEVPNLWTVLPTVQTVRAAVREAGATWPTPAVVVEGPVERFDAFAASDAAAAASGTVTLELALSGVPMVSVYKVNPVTAAIVRRLIRVPYVHMVNLVLQRPAVEELLQERCTPEAIADALRRLLCDPAFRSAQNAASQEVLAQLGGEGPRPSDRAADAVLQTIGCRSGAAQAVR